MFFRQRFVEARWRFGAKIRYALMMQKLEVSHLWASQLSLRRSKTRRLSICRLRFRRRLQASCGTSPSFYVGRGIWRTYPAAFATTRLSRPAKLLRGDAPRLPAQSCVRPLLCFRPSNRASSLASSLAKSLMENSQT